MMDMNTTAYERTVDLFLDVVSNEYPVKGSSIAGISTAVSVNGDIVHAYAAGTSGIAGEALDENTVFRIASISKPITAAAVLLLIEQGKLSLDTKVYDALAQRFPSIPSRNLPGATIDQLRQVTVRDLLRHTSGWNFLHSSTSVGWDPMLNDEEIRKQRYGSDAGAHPLPVTKADILEVNWAFREKDSGTSYANVNYCLLGRLIESIVGEDYGDFVKHEVFGRGRVSGFELGHTRSSERLPRETHYFDSRGAPQWPSAMGDPGPVDGPYGRWNVDNMDSHGGWVATPSALTQFADALFVRGSILNGDSLTSIQSERKNQYGLGWVVWQDLDRKPPNNWRRYHRGLLSGSTSFLMHLPSRDDGHVCYAVTLNTADFAGKLIDKMDLSAQMSTAMWHAVDSLLPGKLTPAPLEAIAHLDFMQEPSSKRLDGFEVAPDS